MTNDSVGKHTAIVIMEEDLTPEEIESLWGQNVCMDDWNYVILTEAKKLKRSKGDWVMQEYAIDRLLNGCSENKWYKAKFRGAIYAIGVAYH